MASTSGVDDLIEVDQPLLRPSRKDGRVSVIVPTCNRPVRLRDALASVRAVQGDDLDIEIVVVDNSQTPNAGAVAREFGARYLCNPVPGVAATRNMGVDYTDRRISHVSR